MTQPTVLYDSHGELRGYMCWHCRWPALGVAQPLDGGDRGGPEDLARWRAAADECCRCFTCKKPLEEGRYRTLECGPCEAASDAASLAAYEKWRASTDPCPRCNGQDYDCPTCEGALRVRRSP